LVKEETWLCHFCVETIFGMATVMRLTQTVLNRLGVGLVLMVLLTGLMMCCTEPGSDEAQPTPTATLTPELTPTPTPTIAWYDYQIVNIYPHDPEAFTEGLVYHEGYLYESTGLYGVSELRKVELETGEIVQSRELAPDYFGEGLTLFDDQLFQLTYLEETCFSYALESFEQLQNFGFTGEGWGLTHDGTNLIMTDGSSYLTFRDPVTFAVIRQLQVMRGDHTQNHINELEFINGLIFANIWLTDRIAVIDPNDGRITGLIDLTGLLDVIDYSQYVDVLNGIAWDPTLERLFVTGKWWPALFEITLVPR